MLAHHSRFAVSILLALLVAACESEGGAPTSLDRHGSGASADVSRDESARSVADVEQPATDSDSSGGPTTQPRPRASAEVCKQLLDAAPLGSLTWEVKTKDDPFSYRHVSIAAYPMTRVSPDGTVHVLKLVLSTLPDPNAWNAKGVTPSEEFTWNIELSDPAASPGVGTYAEPALYEFHAGYTIDCETGGYGSGSGTGSPTSTTVTITERTPTVVRGVIESEDGRVRFEAPILDSAAGSDAPESICCLDDESSSN